MGGCEESSFSFLSASRTLLCVTACKTTQVLLDPSGLCPCSVVYLRRRIPAPACRLTYRSEHTMTVYICTSHPSSE